MRLKSSTGIKQLATGAIMTLVCLAFVSPAISDNEHLVTEFVKAMKKPSDAFAIAPESVTAANIGKDLNIALDIKKEGYLAVTIISQNGDVTFIAGDKKVKPGAVQLWQQLGLPTPKISGPEGYDLLIVSHDTEKSWSNKSGVEMQDAHYFSPELPVLLSRISEQSQRESVDVLHHVVEILPRGGTRALKNKKKPSVPPWLAGTLG